jgi:predicted nucleic acid-binding protein
MIIDTYAWVELLKSTERGKEVANILLRERCYTCITSFAEIAEWAIKNNLENKLEKYISDIKIASTTLYLNERIAVLAGKINRERKRKIKNWGMMDSFITALANLANLKILTGDKHFKDLSNAVML